MIWPGIPFKKCDFVLERNIKSFSSSFNNSSQLEDLGGAFWTANIELAWVPRDEAGQVVGLLAEHGASGLLLPDAPHAIAQGVATGEPVTLGENQGGLVRITGATPNVPNWLRAGDLIQIGSYMYMLRRPVNTDASGHASLPIIPNLRAMPPAGSTVITRDCHCLMQLEAREVLPRRVDPGKRYLASMKLKFVEAIR